MVTQTNYHTTVLLNESIEGLNIKEDGIYVDCTLGGGGHSKLILEKIGAQGKLIVFDQDKDAWSNKPNDERVILIKENFRFIKKFLKLYEIPFVDGILADLGVSSYQFDTGERGFSIRMDGPLDMRMDNRSTKTAAQIIQQYKEDELHQIFEKYGEIRNSKQLAKYLVEQRKVVQITTTQTLKSIVMPIVKGNVQRYFAQLFQALRIEVNDELGALNELLEQAKDILKPGGRLCIISFHSLEDRIVKHFIKKDSSNQEYNPFEQNRTVKRDFIEIIKKPIEASKEEVVKNIRSRSAKLRVAEKL